MKTRPSKQLQRKWTWNYQSLSRVWLFATPWTVAHQAPLSMGIFQARIMQWVVMPSSRGSSQPRNQTGLLHCRQILNHLSQQGSPRILEWVAYHFSRGIFLTQGLNQGLLHCRWILYQLSQQGSPRVLEWVVCPFSSGSSWPRNQTRVSCIADRFLTSWATKNVQSTLQLCSFYMLAR